MYVNIVCDEWVICPIIAHSHNLPSRTILPSGNVHITSAEDMLFEACRYIESHSPQTSNISTTAASNVSEPRGQKVSFRPMTHDDCGLWFAQLEDVFSSLGITSQTNKFAALTTLSTEEEAYVVRDLTLLGRERLADVFDTARMLFVQRFELTIHQRLTRSFSIGGVDVICYYRKQHLGSTVGLTTWPSYCDFHLGRKWKRVSTKT